MSEPPDDLPALDQAAALMADGAARLIDGVERLGAAWVVAAVMGIVDAWDRLDPDVREQTAAAAAVAGADAAARVAAELRALFAQDPAAQRVTPLEIIKSLRREATAVLAASGIPEVERDEFEARAFPDDVYAIVLKSPAELGDDELGGAMLAWGMGKANTLRARAKNGLTP